MNWAKRYGQLKDVVSFLANIVKIVGGIATLAVWLSAQNWIAGLSPRLSWVNAPSSVSWTFIVILAFACAWTGVSVGGFLHKAQIKRVPKPEKLPILDVVALVLLAHKSEGLDSEEAHELLERLHNSRKPERAANPLYRGYSLVQVKAAFSRLSKLNLIDFWSSYSLSDAGVAYYDQHKQALEDLAGLTD